jgi:hypothetical protein
VSPLQRAGDSLLIPSTEENTMAEAKEREAYHGVGIARRLFVEMGSQPPIELRGHYVEIEGDRVVAWDPRPTPARLVATFSLSRAYIEWESQARPSGEGTP